MFKPIVSHLFFYPRYLAYYGQNIFAIFRATQNIDLEGTVSQNFETPLRVNVFYKCVKY